MIVFQSHTVIILAYLPRKAALGLAKRDDNTLQRYEKKRYYKNKKEKIFFFNICLLSRWLFWRSPLPASPDVGRSSLTALFNVPDRVFRRAAILENK